MEKPTGVVGYELKVENVRMREKSAGCLEIPLHYLLWLFLPLKKEEESFLIFSGFGDTDVPRITSPVTLLRWWRDYYSSGQLGYSVQDLSSILNPLRWTKELNKPSGRGRRSGKARGFPRRTIGAGLWCAQVSTHFSSLSLFLPVCVCVCMCSYRADFCAKKLWNDQKEDVQSECFEHRNVPGRIFALGLKRWGKSLGYQTSPAETQ